MKAPCLEDLELGLRRIGSLGCKMAAHTLGLVGRVEKTRYDAFLWGMVSCFCDPSAFSITLPSCFFSSPLPKVDFSLSNALVIFLKKDMMNER